MRRITTLGSGLVATLESEAAAAAAAPAEFVEPIGDNADSVETDLIDITDETAVQAEAEGEVKEACDTVKALEGLADILDGAVQAGGLTPHGAMAVNHMLTHVYKRVGMNTNGRFMPSMESFGSVSDRTSSTKLALESVQETAKKIWDQIVAMWEKIKNYVVDLFNKIFDGATKLKARAEALVQKAGAVGDDKNGGKTIENERLVKALHIEGKVGDVKAALAKVVQVSNDVLKGHKGYGEEVLKEINEAIVGDIGAFESKITLDSPAAGNYKDAGADSQHFGSVPEGFGVFRSDELPGGRAIVQIGPKAELKGEAAVAGYAHVKISVGNYQGNAAKEPAEKGVMGLDKNGAIEVAKLVVSIADNLLAYKANIGAVNSAKDKFLGDIKKLPQAGKDDAENKALSAIKSVAQHAARIVDEPTRSLAVYCVNTGKSALDLVEESLKAASAAPALAAPAKPAEAAPAAEPAAA